ncbi:MAG: ChaN family lipoprotein [Bacteroidetes bacterium]|nr:ChaN family lipoprotein [Bacteroidota bacterium]
MKKLLILPLFLIVFVAMKRDKPAYKIFDVKGKTSSYEEMLEDASKADIVFFGELHDNPICHWLEYELLVDLYKEKGKNLTLGAEMFESDNQIIINEYLKGLVKDKNFESEARLWPNYKADYKPLLSFARDSSLNFIATNVPRRYASMVNSGGFEALSKVDKEALSLIAPLPILFDTNLSCYKEIMKSMGDSPSHASANIAKAQAIKDATMAHFILDSFKQGNIFLHFNGSYHSDHFQGIVWYLKQVNPNLKIVTISSVEQTDPADLSNDSKGLADYILVIPESMTRTQ